ncbi:MAG: macro domain-containing protein [Halieaceae bacterium]
MLYQVSGDILLSKAQVIAHGVAANDPMNQGLAMSLHERYPELHKGFHQWCRQGHPKPGEAWRWDGPGNACIVNLLTQEGGYGHGSRPGKATAKSVNDSLKSLAKMASKEKFSSLALPRLATGVGGMDWTEVEPMVEHRLGELGIPVYIYVEYHAGQKAEEPGL